MQPRWRLLKLQRLTTSLALWRMDMKQTAVFVASLWRRERPEKIIAYCLRMLPIHVLPQNTAVAIHCWMFIRDTHPVHSRERVPGTNNVKHTSGMFQVYWVK